MAKIYDVTIPRRYQDAAGNEKTHFWQVGTMFPLREKEGFSIKLNSKMLLTDQYVVFVRETDESKSDAPPNDDIPF